MPWDNKSGGGWQGGGGGRGPWGQGPQGGGGNQPPDLDELIRRGQEKFRQIFGGGGGPGGGIGQGSGGGRGPIFLIALVIVGMLAYTSFFRVNANEKGIVLRFGDHVRTVQPGLHFKFPYPIETALTPAVTNITSIDVGMRASGGSPIGVPEESLMLTGDENIVDIAFTVQWRIKADEAPGFLFNVQNPDLAVKAVAESMMREAVGASRIEVLQTTGRNEVQEQVRVGLQKTLDEYGAGIEITEVKLQKVDPPAQVLDAFRDVQAARADQERLRNQAETYRQHGHPARPRRGGKDHAGGRSLSRADRGGSGRRCEALHLDLYRVQEGAGCDAPPHLSRNHAGRAWRREQDRGDERRRRRPERIALSTA